MNPSDIKALTFDVFGTVVDWRTSVTNEGEALGKRLGLEADWAAFADAWRGLYQPSMEQVRSGQREWSILDELHRESLDELIERFELKGMSEQDIDHFNRAWHRLHPWPDVVDGLTRLKKNHILATLSNGNVALMVNLAKFGGLPWDAILGAEPTRHYKPLPGAYLGTAKFLGLEPEQCMMVAAHNDDLRQAQSLGFKTAFVARPTEYGPHQSKDFEADGPWDVITDSFVDLAKQMGT